MRALLHAFAIGLAGIAVACSSAPQEWPANGVVREVFADEAQLKIEHGDIEGLMPAMTMSFDVADPALLEGLSPGDFVEFRLRRDASGFTIVALEAPESSSSADDPAPTRRLASARSPAPDFDLVDQNGAPLASSSLRGQPVLLDFIFTRCPGPCPILTGLHADAREALHAEEREQVRFVSISLDPAFDTPEVLRRYAEARRIDTKGWSFLTGPPDVVAEVVRAYGVGTIRKGDGDIDHTVATFLIDGKGRIARRYLGTKHTPEALRDDLRGLL